MSRLPRLLVTLAILAGVAVFAVILLFSAWRWGLAQDINGKVTAIKSAGLPVEWQDLTNWPTSVPDNENAAFIYTNAIAHLDSKSIEDTDFEVSKLRQPIAATMRSQFELIVKNNSQALAIISQVTNAGKSRYPINYLDGPNMLLPHLGGLKDLAKVLECDAILNAEDSNAPAASDDVSSMLKLSQSLDNEPVLISQLASVGILAISSDTFQVVLSQTPLSDAQLSRLEPQFNAAEATNRILTGLIGERAVFNGLLRLARDDPRGLVQVADKSISSDNDEVTNFPNPGASWKILGLFERDRDFYLDAMATNILLIAHGPPASLALAAEDDRLSDEAGNNLDVFSAMFLPAMGGVASRDALNRARLRDAIAAIAVERWRLRHEGALPDSLKDLVPAFLPAVPADPFDGNSLHYKKLKAGAGYCIYSVGPNLRDDGGKEMPPVKVRETNPSWTNYDIVFTVER